MAQVFRDLDHNLDRWVYVMMGDGELDEGKVWEAAMYAAKEAGRNRVATD